MPIPVDPLDEVLRPPVDESPEQRAVRLAREEQARQVSAAIDANITAERNARRKERIVRLLLLGQSESGKSTTLRQFQRSYMPMAFEEERILWRAVIQLNVVRSICAILDALDAHVSPQISPSDVGVDSDEKSSHPHGDRGQHFALGSRTIATGYKSRYATLASDSLPSFPQCQHHSQQTYYSPHIEALKSRLSPIRHIQQLLISKLVPQNEEEPIQLGNGSIGGNMLQFGGTIPANRSGTSNGEVFVRPPSGWRGTLAHACFNHLSFLSRSGGGTSSDEGGRSRSNNPEGKTDEIQEALSVLCGDIILLWQDPAVYEMLKQREIWLEEGTGFFLNDLRRVTSPGYIPSDDDVLKARIKTVGVAEFRFKIEVPNARDGWTEWRIFDVGGSRTQRREFAKLSNYLSVLMHVPSTKATWAFFFDDVNTILFLAPISAFDQVLSEDRTVNRLEDSILLWKAICSNRFLANVNLMLLLSKCDILDQKLKRGVQFARFVTSYRDGENSLLTVLEYMKKKFQAIHKELSPKSRTLYIYHTSVTDRDPTSVIASSVTDMIMRQNLERHNLL